MIKRFIERPVLSTVVSIILLLLGLISLFSLPITLFPDIAPPTVQVTASYPGANAEVVARAVATPQEVIQVGISTQKQQNSMIFIPLIYSTDTAYDETFIQNYVKINIIPELQRIPGVGQAFVFGAKDYSMRIWLKP